MRHVVEGAPQLGMIGDVTFQIVEPLAGRLDDSLEFALGLSFGFTERHLHAAVGVDFTFARGLDRQKDHVLEFVDHRRLHAIGLR